MFKKLFIVTLILISTSCWQNNKQEYIDINNNWAIISDTIVEINWEWDKWNSWEISIIWGFKK